MKYWFPFFVIIILLLTSNIYSQKQSNLESRVKYLELSLDSLKRQVMFHRYLYTHDDIELNKLRSTLALELNRNFTFFATFYEGQPDTMDGNGYKRVFVFSGYLSGNSFNESIRNNQASYLKTIRQNLIGIINTVLGNRREPETYSNGYTTYPHRLIINYYDNSTGGEPIITANTDLKSLKVRIDGIMREVGWE